MKMISLHPTYTIGSQKMKSSNETNHHSSRASSTIASSSYKMVHHLSLGQLIQSFLRGDQDDHDIMCQDIKKTVEEYMALNRVQLSVSERLLAVNEQLLASQLRLLEADNNDAAASAVDRYLMDTAACDSSAASKKNKAAAKKRRNKRNKATAKRKKTKHVPGLNGEIIPQILMVVVGSFMMLFFMSLIHTSDGSERVSTPSLPPTPSLRRNIRQSRQSGVSSSPPTLSMVQSPLFSTSSSSSPNPSTDVSTSINNCVDTPNWKDSYGDDCRYYEDSEAPGCPMGGHLYDGGMGVARDRMGVARDNCCHCKKDPSVSTWTSIKDCVDTPNWEDWEGFDCRYYEETYAPGCHEWGHLCNGGMGVARDNCCYCKKDLSVSTCQITNCFNMNMAYLERNSITVHNHSRWIFQISSV